MIQEIAPHIYDNSFEHRREAFPEDFVLYSPDGKRLLVRLTEEGLEFPTVVGCLTAGIAPEKLHYAFQIDGKAWFALDRLPAEQEAGLQRILDAGLPDAPEEDRADASADGTAEGSAAAGFRFEKQAIFRTALPKEYAFAGITGMQLLRWRHSERFCGTCGHALEPSSWERAFVCPVCGRTDYPRIMPAVIVGVIHGERLLVTSYADRPSLGLAMVAGFNELGETLEETVRREVMEEVGLRVKNIRYYKSQPWSFTDTLLSGFFCELDGEGEAVTLDTRELKEARFLSREELPDRRGEPSLTAEMMEMFREGKI